MARTDPQRRARNEGGGASGANAQQQRGGKRGGGSMGGVGGGASYIRAPAALAAGGWAGRGRDVSQRGGGGKGVQNGGGGRAGVAVVALLGFLRVGGVLMKDGVWETRPRGRSAARRPLLQGLGCQVLP